VRRRRKLIVVTVDENREGERGACAEKSVWKKKSLQLETFVLFKGKIAVWCQAKGVREM